MSVLAPLAVLAVLVAGIVLVALWQSTKQQLQREQAAHEKTRAELSATNTGLELSEAGRSDERRRLEALIAQLKLEISHLETSLSDDPAAVRARLTELLGAVQPTVPVPNPGAGAGPLGVMPFGSTAKG